MRKVVFVTDPMCSWCWGMTSEFEQVRAKFDGALEFDLLLGGINPHGTQPIGEYGRRYLLRLWREVEATTGQSFGYNFPDNYVHNSSRSCLAIEAVRSITGLPPFEYLAELQRLFFMDGIDITSDEVLVETGARFGIEEHELLREMKIPRLLEQVRFQFNHAQSFGTHALPSLLVANDVGSLSLLAGGFVDASMLESLLFPKG